MKSKATIPDKGLLAVSLMLSAFLSSSIQVWASDGTGVLKGRIGAESQQNQSLQPSDMQGGSDPFSNGNQGTGPQDAFAPAGFDVGGGQSAPPPPTKPFNLETQSEGQGDFPGAMGNAQPDSVPNRDPLKSQTITPNNFQQNPNDPDSSPDMQLAWDLWHKRIAEAVYTRFSTLSNAAFQHSRPLSASATYTVTRDGRILNAALPASSWNPIFNTMVIGVINSLQGDMSILAFPPGSRRMTVEQSGTFRQNWGHEGYKFLQGDTETIKGGRPGAAAQPARIQAQGQGQPTQAQQMQLIQQKMQQMGMQPGLMQGQMPHMPQQQMQQMPQQQMQQMPQQMQQMPQQQMQMQMQQRPQQMQMQSRAPQQQLPIQPLQPPQQMQSQQRPSSPASTQKAQTGQKPQQSGPSAEQLQAQLQQLQAQLKQLQMQNH